MDETVDSQLDETASEHNNPSFQHSDSEISKNDTLFEYQAVWRQQTKELWRALHFDVNGPACSNLNWLNTSKIYQMTSAVKHAFIANYLFELRWVFTQLKNLWFNSPHRYQFFILQASSMRAHLLKKHRIEIVVPNFLAGFHQFFNTKYDCVICAQRGTCGRKEG